MYFVFYLFIHFKCILEKLNFGEILSSPKCFVRLPVHVCDFISASFL